MHHGSWISPSGNQNGQFEIAFRNHHYRRGEWGSPREGLFGTPELGSSKPHEVIPAARPAGVLGHVRPRQERNQFWPTACSLTVSVEVHQKLLEDMDAPDRL